PERSTGSRQESLWNSPVTRSCTPEPNGQSEDATTCRLVAGARCSHNPISRRPRLSYHSTQHAPSLQGLPARFPKSESCSGDPSVAASKLAVPVYYLCAFHHQEHLGRADGAGRECHLSWHEL